MHYIPNNIKRCINNDEMEVCEPNISFWYFYSINIKECRLFTYLNCLNILIVDSDCSCHVKTDRQK